MPEAKSGLALSSVVFISLCRILCLDTLVGTTQLHQKSSWMASLQNQRRGFKKTYIFRIIFLTVFISALHGKLRIYDMLYFYNLGFRMFISAATVKSYRKIIKRISEIYDGEHYDMRTEILNSLCFPENCFFVVVILVVFTVEYLCFETWMDVFSCGILDVFTELSMYATCFMYFNVNHIIKRGFVVVYRRSKEINDVNEIKKLWIDYLRLHNAVEKVGIVLADFSVIHNSLLDGNLLSWISWSLREP